MCLSWEGDHKAIGIEFHSPLSFDEVPIDAGRIAVLEAAKLSGEHTVQGVGHHGHDHIEVHLGQDGRRQCIEIEELDRLGDDVFHPPAPGVVTDNALHRGVHVVGDQERRPAVAVSTHGDLAQAAAVAGQLDHGLVDLGILVFAFGMRDVNPLPRTDRIEAFDQLFTPAAQGDELDPEPVELGQIGIGGKLRVEDQHGVHAALGFFPEGQKLQDLVVGLTALYVGGRVQNQLGVSVLADEGQGPLHALVSGARPVLLKHGLIAKVGDGVKVQVDDAFVIQTDAASLPDEGLLQLVQMDGIQ